MHRKPVHVIGLYVFEVPECQDEDTFVTEIEKFKVQQPQESQSPFNPPITEVVWNLNDEATGKITNH